MINVDPGNLWSEVQAAEKYRDNHMKTWQARKDRYVGPSYGEQDISKQYDPENHEFEYLSLVIPKIIFDNPKVRISTIRQDQMDVALAIQAGLNRWIRDVRLRKVLNGIATDMLLLWGVALVSMEMDAIALPQNVQDKAPGPHFRPRIRRLSPKRFFWDPAALSMDECRYYGHSYVIDKTDLIARASAFPDEGWDLEAIKGLSSDESLKDQRRNVEVPDRGEIVLRDIYVVGYQVDGEPGSDQGYNGAIFTIAVGGGKASQVRAPRMYYGPDTGPYIYFGVYNVPDETASLSPTAAISTQVDMLNAHARACSRAASRRKKFLMVQNTDPKLADVMNNANDGDTVLANISDIRNNAIEFEVGGLTPQMLEGLSMERERRDRISGMSDAMRGNVSGDSTATENAIASESGAARIGFIKQQFGDAVSQLLLTVAWYLYHDDRIVFPIEGGQSIPGQALYFMGGTHDDGSGSSFRDLDLEIEPYSMERTSEQVQQKRLMELTTIIGSLLPQAMQLPVDIKALFDLVGNFANVPELSKIVNLEAAQMMQMMALQGMVQPNPTQPARLSGDVGAPAEPESTPMPGVPNKFRPQPQAQ